MTQHEKELTAVVVGTGFAGKGHTEALRYNGVSVTGIVGRTGSVVEQVAEELGIPECFTNINEALSSRTPSIVSVGTPGGAHMEPVESALRSGCAVICDKPLAANAADARKLYELSVSQKCTTAYAASYRYQPHALFARQLVHEGAIGEPWEVECVSHYNLNPLIPFGWSHKIDAGGGRLNNNFTHKLAIVLHILDGELKRVTGETRNDMKKAPVVEGVHDFRYRENLAPDSRDDESLNWADVDSEWSYTVLSRIDSRIGTADPISAMFKHSALQPPFASDYIAVYGSDGALFIEGAYAQGPVHLRKRNEEWTQLELPRDIVAAIPDIEDDTQRNWTQLIKELVLYLHGEGSESFQTFRDGWIYQQAIDAIRAQDAWTDIRLDLLS